MLVWKIMAFLIEKDKPLGAKVRLVLQLLKDSKYWLDLPGN